MSVALITGGARRVGSVITAELAARGHTVIIHTRTKNDDAAHEMISAIQSIGGKAHHISGDLADSNIASNLLGEATEMVREPIDLLINNAAIFEDDSINTVSADSWDKHQNVNLRAPLLLSQAFATQLPHPAKGMIVNIIDQRVWRLNPTFLSYTASKAGLWAITQTLAQALAPRIRVNAIGPGPVFSSIHQDAHGFQREARNVPLGHGPEPKEIAEAIAFLLETPSITGQMIALDGGQHLAWQTPDVRK